MSTLSVNDHVIADPRYAPSEYLGVIYTVTEIKPTKLTLTPLAGGRRIRMDPGYFQPAPPELVADALAGRSLVIDVPVYPFLDLGMIVTVGGPEWDRPAGELYTVIGIRSNSDVKIAKLGGDTNGAYWPGLRRGRLTIIDFARLTLAPEPPEQSE